jgi:hypothetical protein
MKQPVTPKTSYYIRIAAGAYLLYTAYSLISDWGEVKPEHRLAIGAAIVVFAIVGFILCLLSALGLNKYNKDQADKHADPVNTEGQTEQEKGLDAANDAKEAVKEEKINEVDNKDASDS